MMENLATSLKNNSEPSIDSENYYYKDLKHQNVHDIGEEYLKLVKKKFGSKPINELPIKEKVSYL